MSVFPLLLQEKIDRTAYSYYIIIKISYHYYYCHLDMIKMLSTF